MCKQQSYFLHSKENDDTFSRFLQGDEKAFTSLYREMYERLLNYGRKITKDDFVIKSAMQEAFLKTWSCRERMESVIHIYRFVRLNVTWQCIAYYRNPVNKFHRQIVFAIPIESLAGNQTEDTNEQDDLFAFDEEKLQLIENVLPYLPLDKQTIVKLYFKHGVSYKKIAQRFGTSAQSVSTDLQQCLDHLKNLVHARKKLEGAPPNEAPDLLTRKREGADEEMTFIFKMRYENKMGFETIASKLNVSTEYVQRQYLEARRRFVK